MHKKINEDNEMEQTLFEKSQESRTKATDGSRKRKDNIIDKWKQMKHKLDTDKRPMFWC